MDRRTLLGMSAMALTAMAAKAETALPGGTLPSDPTEAVPLWPGTPPGGEGVHLTAEIVERSTDTAAFHDRYMDKIGSPSMLVFRPAQRDGSAVLIAPGGGYVREVLDKEGYEMARRLNKAGVTVFVLRYRLPGEGWANRSDVPLQDAQRALRLIRAGATRYGLDENRVGVMGFSAGGHVAASLATRYGDKVYDLKDGMEEISARPDFACLMYPVITMGAETHQGSRDMLLGGDPTPEMIDKYSCEKHAFAAMPPCFVCYAADDLTVPPSGNGLAMYQALVAAKVPSELHAFQEGGHGFGIRLAGDRPCSVWPDLFLAWARRGGWIKG